MLGFAACKSSVTVVELSNSTSIVGKWKVSKVTVPGSSQADLDAYVSCLSPIIIEFTSSNVVTAIGTPCTGKTTNAKGNYTLSGSSLSVTGEPIFIIQSGTIGAIGSQFSNTYRDSGGTVVATYTRL